jgi:VWFA-related protein
VLDVVVTDAKGKPIPNLTRDDFTIDQDGKVQNIHDFEGWTGRPTPSTAPAFDRYGRPTWGDGVSRTVFVLDELNTPFDQKAYAAEELKNFLSRQPELLASPATLVTVSYTGLKTLAPYTRNRDSLLHALAHRPPALPAAINNLELAASSFAMLRQIAMASMGLKTHINLVWLGTGFPTLDPNDFNDPDEAILKKAVEDTINLLIDARVTVDLIDPTPIGDRLAVPNMNIISDFGGSFSAQQFTIGSDPLESQFSFNTFVNATGGGNYYGRNDLNAAIADTQLRGVDFYTLAYRPPAMPDDGAYHAIRVAMHDPTMVVQTRQGFYATQGLPSMPTLKDLGFDLKLAATGQMTFSSIGTRITSVSAAGHNSISLNISIDDSGLQWTPRDGGGDTARVTVLLVSLDKNREIQTSTAYNLDLAVKNPGEVAAGHVEFTKQLALNSKSQFVRLIIRDASGRIGTADIDAVTLANLPEQH